MGVEASGEWMRIPLIKSSNERWKRVSMIDALAMLFERWVNQLEKGFGVTPFPWLMMKKKSIFFEELRAKRF